MVAPSRLCIIRIYSIPLGRRRIPVFSGHLALQPATQLVLLDFQIIACLQIHPEILGHPKITRQSQGGIRADGAFAMYDFIDAPRRHGDILGQGILAQADAPMSSVVTFQSFNVSSTQCDNRLGLIISRSGSPLIAKYTHAVGDTPGMVVLQGVN